MHVPSCRNLFDLVVGSYGTVLHAQETWQVKPSGVTSRLWSVAKASTQRGAAGEQGAILTPLNHTAWIPRRTGVTRINAVSPPAALTLVYATI